MSREGGGESALSEVGMPDLHRKRVSAAQDVFQGIRLAMTKTFILSIP